VAELELGLEEVGLQPVDRIRIQLVLAQGLGGGSGECQVGAELALQRRLVQRVDGRGGQAGVDQRHRRRLVTKDGHDRLQAGAPLASWVPMV